MGMCVCTYTCLYTIYIVYTYVCVSIYGHIYLYVCILMNIHTCVCYLHQNYLHLIPQSLLTQKRDKNDGSIWKNFLLENIPSELDSMH